MKIVINIKLLKLRNYFYQILGILFLFFITPSHSNAQIKKEINQKSLTDTQYLANQKLKNERKLAYADSILEEEDKKTEYAKKFFGYKIFNSKNVNFEPNLNMATPKSYVVGPNDELVLQVFGDAQKKYEVIVSNEGQITIPDIGISQIGGLTIEAVQSLLTQKMSIRYSGMRGANPNTFLQISISNIRTIKINMVGEISVPGAYSLPSYVNVFNALFAAGGPTIKGSFRAVLVYRNNRQVAEIDLYDYIVNGKISQNVRLEDNDVILVRPSSNLIFVNGEFRSVGIYEMKPKETLKDLFKYTGGFSENAYKELVTIQRKGISENQIFDITSSQFSNVSLIDGDIVTASPILDKISNRVVVSGAITRPGQYELVRGMRVRDIVQKAGGFKGDAFLKNVILYRTKNDFTQELINLDLSKNNPADTTDNILLQKEDAISVKSIIDLREEYYVQISGEINNTGAYSFVDSMSVFDLILLAEGAKYSPMGYNIEIARRNRDDPSKVADIISFNSRTSILNSDSLKMILLRPFDHVFIRKPSGFQSSVKVTISGEILFPGDYITDKKEMRISDLIKRSGGLTNYAYPYGATLLRRTKSFVSIPESEKENQNLNSIRQNINKDSLIANLEINVVLNKRLNSKITQNNDNNEEELKKINNDKSKERIIDDNLKESNKKSEVKEEEKPQDLVAIDMNKIILKPGSSDDLILKDGDVLNIPELIQTVSIKGGVLFPVSTKFENNLSFKDYIRRAGGYARLADKKKSYVIQVNGKVEVVKSFLFFKTYPKVFSGAEIFVPVNKGDRPPVSFERGLGVLTSSLTLIFLLRSL